MGPGIEPGIWYSPFIVYDFNGDGKAEVAIKTAADDYVKNEKGRVCGGSEYLSVLDGMTGKEIDRVDWPERNDRYGNLIRQNRNQMGGCLSGWKDTLYIGCPRHLQTDGGRCLDAERRKTATCLALGWG